MTLYNNNIQLIPNTTNKDRLSSFFASFLDRLLRNVIPLFFIFILSVCDGIFLTPNGGHIMLVYSILIPIARGYHASVLCSLA